MELAPRVLIRTLPILHGNYGGMLQAYALQQALIALGTTPVTDISVTPTWRSRATQAAMPLKRVITDQPVFRREANAAWNSRLNAFATANIRMTSLMAPWRCGVHRRELEGLDAIVVGSDQIWRSAYGDVASYLLKMVPLECTARRVAYAASFGSQDHVQERQLSALRPLAERFSAISVREDWAVALVQRTWGIEAFHAQDPVLLLEADHYRKLTAAVPRNTAPYALAFTLDPTQSASKTAAHVADQLSMPLMTYTPPAVPLRHSDIRLSPHKPIGMEEWISLFRDASFVITDSFHGAVMAITFEVPFLVVGNISRGSGRFESLLRKYGLEDRMWARSDAPSIRDGIDWASVAKATRKHRSESIAFLQGSIAAR